MTTTPAAVTQYVGYDWLIPAQLTDSNGAPLNISTWTIAGDLWLPGQSSAQATVLSATITDLPNAKFSFKISKTLTAAVAPQNLAAITYPCRIMVNYTDASSNKFALRPIFILPLDPRTSPL